MQENLTVTTDINLYYDLLVPENTDEPAPLLLALHGYGESKRRMMREAQQMAPEGFAIAALQAPYQHIIPPKEPTDPLRFGFGWLTNYRPGESIALHHKFVLDVIEKLVAEGVADEKKIFLLGFSQTSALNFKFAFTHPEILRGVAGLCGGVPGDLETNELYRETGADVFYLYGTQDKFYPLEKFQEFAQRLSRYAKNLRHKQYEAPHEITPEMRADIKAWLAVLSV
jgi:predicted esterase